MMGLIRMILKGLISVLEPLFRPRFQQHAPDQQAKLDALTSTMALYQFAACPFCVKVRWAMRRLGLNIELRDAKNNATHREALLLAGGKSQVPCLRRTVQGGEDTWMYESSDIITYLEGLAATTHPIASSG